MTEVLEQKEAWVADFERLGAGLPGLPALRRRAIDRFAETGFPTGHEERWRFTDVSPATETLFRPPATPGDASPFAGLSRGPLRECQVTFVDGRPAPELSSSGFPKGVTVTPLASLLRKDPGSVEPHLAAFESHPFAALNTAFMNDGAVVRIARGAAIEKPIHLLFLNTFRNDPHVTHPRILVVAGEDAQATVVESHLGPAGGVYLTNAVTEIVLGDGALLDYAKVQRESHEAFHFATVQTRQGRGSRLAHHSISLGARLACNDIGAALDGEGAECNLYGLYEVAGSQVVDHHTLIDHLRPRAASRELYKGILDGASRAVFDGRIIVRPDAQKTNAVQTNRNLILSDKALVHTKPQLEIFADDVKCKHGATIGRLDDDVLFYLRSRGIGMAEARRLLIHAFASEIVDLVRIPAVRSQLGGCLGLMVGGA